MLSAVPMLKLNAVVLHRDERAVLHELGRLGVLQILREKAGPDTAPLPPADRRPERERCDRLLARAGEVRRTLGLPPAASGEAAGDGAQTMDNAERDLDRLEREAGERVQQREAARQKLARVSDLLDQVSSLRETGVPFDDLDRVSFLHFAIGSLPGDRLEPLKERVGSNVILLPLKHDKGRTSLVAVTSRAGRLSLETALRQAGFQPAESLLPGEEADAIAGEGGRERDRLQAAATEADRALAEFAAAAAPRLDRLERDIRTERRLLEAEEHFPRTDATALIAGWLPAADADRVVARLKDVTQGRCAIEIADPRHVPDEQVPVLLRHSRLLRPFELLVAGYGLPRYRELEPTLFVAITYVLMFGMMFGDAGHGAVLALGGLAALRTARTPKVRDVGVLFILAGLSSIAFGLVYGSVFGLASFRAFALWRDPLEGDPLSLMFTAMGIGVVIISLGLVLNIVNRFRRGDIEGGFLDKFGIAGALFYWGILAVILKYAALKERGLAAPVLTLVVLLPVSAWILRKPVAYARRRRARGGTGGGVLTVAMESVVETFEAVLGYMANTISFIRLAAYAMSHAAILMAAFVLAAELEKIPAAGGALSVLIIVLGNILAILLEGVIAAVQALRLEYYEFFGKFFSGGGQAFTPFRLGPEGEPRSFRLASDAPGRHNGPTEKTPEGRGRASDPAPCPEAPGGLDSTGRGDGAPAR